MMGNMRDVHRSFLVFWGKNLRSLFKEWKLWKTLLRVEDTCEDHERWESKVSPRFLTEDEKGMISLLNRTGGRDDWEIRLRRVGEPINIDWNFLGLGERPFINDHSWNAWRSEFIWLIASDMFSGVEDKYSCISSAYKW